MRRRDFTWLLGAAPAWPLVARAQPLSLRRLGVLMVIDDRPDVRSWVAATVDALGKAGWTEGQNLQVDVRFGWSEADPSDATRTNSSTLGRTSSWLRVSWARPR